MWNSQVLQEHGRIPSKGLGSGRKASFPSQLFSQISFQTLRERWGTIWICFCHLELAYMFHDLCLIPKISKSIGYLPKGPISMFRKPSLPKRFCFPCPSVRSSYAMAFLWKILPRRRTSLDQWSWSQVLQPPSSWMALKLDQEFVLSRAGWQNLLEKDLNVIRLSFMVNCYHNEMI